MLAIYVRVSEVGDRDGPSFGSPAEQETAARSWAERAGIDVYFNEDECIDLDVSGATEVSERKLGRLIERCESGEFTGIIVRDESRFSRDPIEGVVALARLDECEARLVATQTGFDSKNLTPDSQMLYEFKLSMGKAERSRNRLARVNGSRRAADRGIYLAPAPPLGYRWVEGTQPLKPNGKLGSGRIEPDPVTGPQVQDMFQRRSEGESLYSLAAWLRERGHKYTKSGVRVLLSNRCYLGEQTVPTARKGELEVRKNAHHPLVTEEQWERAQAAGGPYHPRNGKWAALAQLTGIAVCSGCGKALSVGGGGKKKDTAYYSCTSEACPARVGMRVDRLDDFARYILQAAIVRGVPEVIALVEGSDRYTRTLEQINEASLELEAYRREVKISDVGAEAWKRDVATRTEALALARKELASLPAPKPVTKAKARRIVTYDEALPGIEREVNQKYFSRIVVQPVGRGRRVAAELRTEVWFHGAAEPWVEPAGNPETVAAMRAAQAVA
jgi:hypothetical protein